MHLLSQSKFQYTGVFQGYVRNLEGKRRLVLTLVNDQELQFKVEKEVRKEWEDRLHPGALITVTGFEHYRLVREVKRVIKRIKLLKPGRREPDACEKCVIRICAKKNCWRSGGKELMAEVKERLAEAGLTDEVEVKAVGCMDQCKRAPNLEFQKHIHSRCSSVDVARIVARIAAKRREEA